MSPQKPLRPCSRIGCHALTRDRYCTAHADTERQRANEAKERNRTHDHLYGATWRKARAAYLLSHPLCVMCEQVDRLTPAKAVDHIAPHEGDMNLFWDEGNWQGLCWSCHSRKTWKETNERRGR